MARRRTGPSQAKWRRGPSPKPRDRILNAETKPAYATFRRTSIRAASASTAAKRPVNEQFAPPARGRGGRSGESATWGFPCASARRPSASLGRSTASRAPNRRASPEHTGRYGGACGHPAERAGWGVKRCGGTSAVASGSSGTSPHEVVDRTAATAPENYLFDHPDGGFAGTGIRPG